MKKLAFFCVLWWILAVFPAAAETFLPASTPLIPGVDVSAWKGEIDFRKIAEAGIEIVYIRAGEGAGYTDAYFERNYAAAAEAGLKVGLYYFVTALSEAEAVSQAEYFAGLVNGRSLDCRLALDYGVADQLTNDELTRYARAFLSTVKARTGLDTVLYTDAYGARARYEASLADIPLWVADYGALSPEPNGKWAYWVGWQYSDRGRVNGVTGNVDMDHFTKEIYLAEPTPTPTPTPGNSTPQFALLTPSETLETLALRYGVAVESIRDINRIPASGARAGQILRIINAQTPARGAVQSLFVAPHTSTVRDTALHFGLTADDLRRVNELPSQTVVYAG